MNVQFNDIMGVAIITAGLLVFTYLLFVSKNKRKKLQDRRERIKRNWTERL